MEINIKNENLSVCSGVCRTKNNFTTETDVIVPDSKPDILKVLQLSARPKVTLCETRNGQVIVSGTLTFNILYLADDEEKCVKSITSSCEFSNLIKDSNIGDSMLTFVDVDVSDIAVNIANCRKLTLRATLLTSLRVYSQRNLELVSDIEGACTKKNTIYSGTICASAQSSASITDSFELSQGKSDIEEILKTDAWVTDSELKVIDDKAIIKGNVRVTVLYKSQDGLEYAQTECSFAHVLEVDGIHSDMTNEFSVKLTDIDAAVSANEDGKNNIIELSCDLLFRVIARSRSEFECVVDAYIPHGALQCSHAQISVEDIETVIHTSNDFKEKITLPASCPPIGAIYQTIARPFIESCYTEGGKINISGYTEVYLLYLSSDENSPVYSHKANIDFSALCDSPGCMLTPVAEAQLRNISYTINAENCVEIRGSVDINVQCIRNTATEVIYDASIGEYTPPERPSIIVSCVSEGRSLWDIAKEYAVDQNDILLANALESCEDIMPGTALIIPK